MPLRQLLVALAVLLGAAGTSLAANEVPLAEILARVETAYGAEAPAAIREIGTTTSFRRGEGSLLRLYKAPDRFRIELGYAGGGESRALVGERAWQQDRPASTALRGAVTLQAARVALPWNLLARRAEARDLGSVQGPGAGADARPLRAVELVLAADLRLVVEIDPDKGHILRSRGIQSLAGSTLEFATVYADFGSDGGRLHARSEQHYAMGQHIGHSKITRVEYPATLTDSAFMPATADAVPAGR